MPKKNKGKKSKERKIAMSDIAPGMVIIVKKEEVTVVDIQELKSKRGGLKFKVIATTNDDKKVKITKPGERMIPIISGGEHLSSTASKTEDNESAVIRDDDYSVANAAAGASKTVPIRAGEVRKGTYVMLKGKPCKVIDVSISKTGKHGHAKANITGLDVFTGRKYVEISPTSHNMVAPTMFRSEWQLTDVSSEGEVTLMNDVGTMKEDLNLPKDTHGEYTALSKDVLARYNALDDGKGVFCIVLKAMDTEQIVDFMVKDA